MDRIERDLRLGEVFTPAAPIDRLNLFCRSRPTTARGAGRNPAARSARRVVWRAWRRQDIARKRAPRVPRGRGTVRHRAACELRRRDDYTAIWRKAFDDLQFIERRRTIGFTPEIQEIVHSVSEFAEGTEPLTPHQVRQVLERLGEQAILVVIIDEFDRVARRAGTQFANTIKMLSDQAVPATLVLVGVAQTVSALIREHESIERALAQVRVPRMSTAELHEIVDGGLAAVGMNAEALARDRIASLSQGLPHYTHLITLYAARHANDSESNLFA